MTPCDVTIALLLVPYKDSHAKWTALGYASNIVRRYDCLFVGFVQGFSWKTDSIVTSADVTITFLVVWHKDSHEKRTPS